MFLFSRYYRDCALFFTVLLISSISLWGQNIEATDKNAPVYQAGELYFKLGDDVKIRLNTGGKPTGNKEIDAFLSKYPGSVLRKSFTAKNNPWLDRVYRISRLPNGKEEEAATALSRIKIVVLTERIPANYVHQAIPNDPDYDQCYQLPLINAEASWGIHQGGSVIAIVDDAVLTDHEDLSANSISGFDVADDDADPRPPLGLPGEDNPVSPTVYSHGTHVAGIAAGVTNNGVGIASPGWNNTILPVKTNTNTTTSPRSIPFGYEGVKWAVANGAEVINMSWGGGEPSEVNYQVMLDARNAGIILVASAGNRRTDTPSYPAAYGEGLTGEPWEEYDRNLVLAVASIDEDLSTSVWPWPFGSNFGSWVDIAAYGTSIYSSVGNSATINGNRTYLTDEYNNYTGTSMAAPLVSGAAGLLLSYRPDLSVDEIITCLVGSANNDVYSIGGNPSRTLGSGRLDLHAALQCLAIDCSTDPIAVISPDNSNLCTSGEVTLSANTGIAYQWSTGETTQSILATTAGDYSVTVSFSGGCEATATYEFEGQSISTCPAELCGDCDKFFSFFINAGSGTYINQTALHQFESYKSCIYLEGKLIVQSDQVYRFIECNFYMGPGASIEVEGKAKLEMYGNTLISCTDMWRGITVLQKGEIEAVNNTFRDAEYALQLQQGSQSTVQDNFFENNHVGVYVPGISNTPVFFTEAMTGNIFSCGTPCSLANSYPGQATNPDGQPYAGILLLDAGTITIGDENNPNTTANVFIDIKNGIVAHNTNLACFNAEFAYLISSGSTGTNIPSNGNGIYVDNGSIQVRGNDFYELQTGILGTRSSIAASDNEFDYITTGIKIDYAKDKLDISGNLISFIRNGIIINRTEGVIPFSISDNTVNTRGNDSDATGIDLVDGTPGSSSNFASVENNTLFIHDRADGIKLRRWNFTQLQNNKIRFTIGNSVPAPWPATGILLIGTRDVRTYGSEIWATQPSSQHIYGQHVQSGIRTSICCSSTRDILVGFYFSKNNWATSFRHNIMENNYQMLHIRDGFIQSQSFARNEFRGQPMSINDYSSWPANMQSYLGSDRAHAIYKAAGSGWQSSRFQLQPNDCNTDKWPSIVIPAQSCPGNGSEWFYSDGTFGLISDCGFDSGCPGSSGDGEGEVAEPGKKSNSPEASDGKSLQPAEFSVAPNPANQRLNITYQDPLNTNDVKVDLIGVNGQVVFTQSFPGDLIKETIDIGDLTPGLYLIRLTDRTGLLQSRKVIVQR